MAKEDFAAEVNIEVKGMVERGGFV